jgi:hypothetical protein
MSTTPVGTRAVNRHAETSSTESTPENSPMKLPPPTVSPIKKEFEIRLVNPSTFGEVMGNKQNPDTRRLVLQQQFLETFQKTIQSSGEDKSLKSSASLNESLATYNYQESLQHLSNSNMYSNQAQAYYRASDTASQASAVFKNRMRSGLESVPMRTSANSQQQ